MEIKRDSASKSPWQETAIPLGMIQQPADNTVYDALIIGGGITGITTALLLQKQGKRCLLVEGHNLGFGTTGGTTAHINTFFDSTYPEIESAFGEDAAKLVANAGKEAIEMISSLVNTYQIDCDLETKKAYLFSQNEKESKQLMEILNSALNAGVEVTQVKQNGVPIEFHRTLEFTGQAQLHPTKYIFALAEEFVKIGGIIIDQTFINDVKTKDGIHTANADQRYFKASNVIYATHIPPGINQFNFRCAPYRSYVLGVRLTSEVDYPPELAYDMQEPYHYFRTHTINGEKLLIIGGEDHKTGHEDPEQAFKNLEEYAYTYFDIKQIAFRWSSQYYVPVDGLPYIGSMSGGEDSIFVATGFNGNGITWGTIAAKVISDAIVGKENAYADLFKPSRMKPVAGFTEFVKENADVAYHFIADRFNTEELDSITELEKEEGKVVDFKGEKIAVYKDKNGIITALHPTCTHAGCTVKFNAAEKSWDCPCHGGRFGIDGKVISGPPREDLGLVHNS